MKPFAIGLLALIGVVGIGIFIAVSRPVPAPEAPSPAPHVVVASPSPPPAVTPSVEEAPVTVPPKPAPVNVAKAAEGSRYARIVIKEGDPVPELFPHQAERETISQLATTYDPTQIPKIAAYLGHSDAMVREAARVGLIQLGDAAAAPVLTEAAKKAPTPEEAALLREAAEFLALPLFVDIVLPPHKSS